MSRTSSTAAEIQQIKAARLRTFHHRLSEWYATHGRHDLPWRKTADPYHIWVSEVMLQQTQVATVLARFYFPFLAKFPTVEALAAAPRESVMKAWEGLGYYRRAGYLHEAAKQLVSEGGLPPFASLTPPLRGSPTATHGLLQRLLNLPGIGRNTAHAILAFGYHQPVAILEANVKRVLARIFALENPNEKQLWEGADILLNIREPFDYNQAMMDVGSLICTPRNPRCDECPANLICEGKTSPEIYPAPKAKKQIPTRYVNIVVREDASGKLYLEQRSDALLGGLYGFAQVNVIARSGSDAAIQKYKKTGSPRYTRDDGVYLANVTHTYSHFHLVGAIYYQQLPIKKRGKNWHARADISALPLSKLDHKVLAVIDARHSRQPNAT
jgi:A/G-specific adenine glycosylase